MCLCDVLTTEQQSNPWLLNYHSGTKETNAYVYIHTGNVTREVYNLTNT